MRTATNSPRYELYKLLDAGRFDHALICTYTFDASFFEDYCLSCFPSLRENGNISILLDHAEYESLTHEPQEQRPRYLNLRYLLYPIKARGRFHPKLILLAGRDKGRLLIGSANFTRAGLSGNAELAGCYDYRTGEQEQFVSLFRSAFSYVRRLASRWPSRNLESNLEEMRRGAAWLDEEPVEIPGFKLLHNLDDPLLPQIVALLNGRPVRTFSALSRYFDQSPAILDDLIRETGAKKLNFFTQNWHTTLSPAWLDHPSVRGKSTRLYLEEFKSHERIQPLHAKLFVLESDKLCIVAYGSANCTSAGLLRRADHGNVEILLAITNATPEGRKSAARLLDPNGTAILLSKSGDLHPAPPDKPPGPLSFFDIRLQEAEIDEERLTLRIEGMVKPNSCARIEVGLKGYKVIQVRSAGQGKLTAPITAEFSKRLSLGSALVRLENTDGEAISNSVFLTNLRDFSTGVSARHERRIREAEGSAAAFLEILADLAGSEDDASLKNFLAYCDIAALLSPCSHRLHRAKAVWQVGGGVVFFGPQWFEISNDLRELAVGFCNRHFRRLERHAAERDPEGIANFLHIALAIGAVLRLQIERATRGLEARPRVSTTEWSEFRSHCDEYFGLYRRLAALIWIDYLAKMIREHPAQKIREEFEPDLQPLMDLACEMLAFRPRIEQLRTRSCTSSDSGLPFGYFFSVLDESRWHSYESEVQNANDNIRAAILN